MKKENVLVVALVVIALAGVYVYNSLNPKGGGSGTGTQDAPSTGISSSVAPGGIQWKDYTPGMAMARESQKSIFLYFHAPWCTYCTKLKATTFKDEKVISYLSDNFISIQVDTDQNKALAAKWGITGLPTMWFLDPEGKKINKMPGYVNPGQMLQILRYIHTKSYTTMEFHEFIKQS